MDPLTVEARPPPVVEKVTEPLTVVSVTSPFSRVASISPLTVLPTSATPAGTRTVKRTLTSLFCTFIRPPSPGRHSFGRWPSRLGYTAQMVTPPAWGTTSIRTDSGLSRLARFTATTSTWLLPEGSARTSPLTPLISIACPCGMAPRHWKSCAPAGRAGSEGRTQRAKRERVFMPA